MPVLVIVICQPESPGILSRYTGTWTVLVTWTGSQAGKLVCTGTYRYVPVHASTGIQVLASHLEGCATSSWHDIIHDIISCWYWLWYHGFQNDYDIIDLWYHSTMISYFCDYDINNLWCHRSMISWPISYTISSWSCMILYMISCLCNYDINNLWYHRSMISWPIS